MKLYLAYILLIMSASLDVHLFAADSENIFSSTYTKIRKKLKKLKQPSFKHDYSIRIKHYDVDRKSFFNKKGKSIPNLQKGESKGSKNKESKKKLVEYKIKIWGTALTVQWLRLYSHCRG